MWQTDSLLLQGRGVETHTDPPTPDGPGQEVTYVASVKLGHLATCDRCMGLDVGGNSQVLGLKQAVGTDNTNLKNAVIFLISFYNFPKQNCLGENSIQRQSLSLPIIHLNL